MEAEDFALSLCFNDGCCPICNQQVYSKDSDTKYNVINVNLDKGIEHYNYHMNELEVKKNDD